MVVGGDSAVGKQYSGPWPKYYIGPSAALALSTATAVAALSVELWYRAGRCYYRLLSGVLLAAASGYLGEMRSGSRSDVR